jgi:flagellar biogenesis protein FliO
VAATILVIGLLYASLWGLRTFTQQGRFARAGLGLVHVRTSVRLGTNQTLHVVQFGSQVLLVGASQAGLTLLAKMADSSADEASATFDQALEIALTEAAK